MAADATINWIKSATGKNVDGSTLLAGSELHLVSRYHLFDPNQYIVERLIPKMWWRLWGKETVPVTRLDAMMDGVPGSRGGRFRSDPIWKLPAIDNESGLGKFQARTDSDDALSGVVMSSRMWLNRRGKSSKKTGEIGGRLSVGLARIGPEVEGRTVKEEEWGVEVVEDPWVQITVLQGPQVLAHLLELEQALGQELDLREMPGLQDLSGDAFSYFVDEPIQPFSLQYRLEPKEPLLIGIGLPATADLRAAFCVRVESLEDGSVATSEPRFFTNVSDLTIATDLTIDMLRPEPRNLLFRFSEAHFDLPQLSAEMQSAEPLIWSRLVDAATELGAASISEAALLAGTADLAPA
ncbi:MAG: hypothetical protein ACJ71T_01400 [Actinomycetales bacterium]